MTGNSRQAGAERRSDGRLGGTVLASVVITAITAAGWTWWYITDVWIGPTPWWAHVLFWSFLAGLPFLIGIAVKHRFSALLAPIGNVAGAIVATMMVGVARVGSGDMHPAFVLFIWSAIMLIAWTVGHAIRGALTAPPRIPDDY